MNATMNMNGKGRKSLAGQIDRLDSILDGMADGLNEAVATAVKEAVTIAVREAVQGVLTEVLSNPQLLAHLHTQRTSTTTTADPDWAAIAEQPKRQSVRSRLGAIRSWIRRKVLGLVQLCGSVLIAARRIVGNSVDQTRQVGCAVRQQAGQLLRGCWQRLQVVRLVKLQLLLALCSGVALGTATYFATPFLAALVGGLGGFALTAAVQVGLWLQRLRAAMTGAGP